MFFCIATTFAEEHACILTYLYPPHLLAEYLPDTPQRTCQRHSSRDASRQGLPSTGAYTALAYRKL